MVTFANQKRVPREGGSRESQPRERVKTLLDRRGLPARLHVTPVTVARRCAVTTASADIGGGVFSFCRYGEQKRDRVVLVTS